MKLTLRCLLYLLPILCWGQYVDRTQVLYVTTDPTGACGYSYITVNKTTQATTTCDNGTWATVSGGGATPAGPTNAVQTNGGGGTLAGSASNQYLSTALPTPSAPTLSVTCSGTCATTYSYVVLPLNLVGHGVQSPPASTAVQAATLDGSHFNRITPQACTGSFAGVTGWLVYRTVAAGTPSSLGLIGSTTGVACAGHLDDNGLTGNFEFPYISDQSTGQYVAGTSNILGHMAIGNNASVDNAFEYASDGGYDGYTYKVMNTNEIINPSAFTDPRGIGLAVVGHQIDLFIQPAQDNIINGAFASSFNINTQTGNSHLLGSGGYGIQSGALNHWATGVAAFNGTESNAFALSPGSVLDSPQGFFSAIQDFGGGITGTTTFFTNDPLSGTYENVKMVWLKGQFNGTVITGTLRSIKADTGSGIAEFGDGVQVDASSTNPTCAASGDIGKLWFDSTVAATTVFKVCKSVASAIGWSVVTTTP